MPRIRTIRPEMWEDEKFGTLCMMSQLAWVGLISMSDDAGRLKYNARLLRTRLWPYKDVHYRRRSRGLCSRNKRDRYDFRIFS